MRTLLDPSEREALLQRFRCLNPESRPEWGSLTAPRMVCHLADALRVALGELPARDGSNLLSRSLVRWLVVHTGLQPPPGRIATAPEMLTSQPTSWADDCRTFENLVGRLAGGAELARHPFFGPLSRREWGLLSWKHIDHHLRQFGV